VRKRWGTWQKRINCETRLLNGRCAVYGHRWETANKDPDKDPPREKCAYCGTVREWNGGPPPCGQWDILPPPVTTPG
jgi:hypothetical protein